MSLFVIGEEVPFVFGSYATHLNQAVAGDAGPDVNDGTARPADERSYSDPDPACRY